MSRVNSELFNAFFLEVKQTFSASGHSCVTLKANDRVNRVGECPAPNFKTGGRQLRFNAWFAFAIQGLEVDMADSGWDLTECGKYWVHRNTGEKKLVTQSFWDGTTPLDEHAKSLRPGLNLPVGNRHDCVPGVFPLDYLGEPVRPFGTYPPGYVVDGCRAGTSTNQVVDDVPVNEFDGVEEMYRFPEIVAGESLIQPVDRHYGEHDKPFESERPR